MMNLRAILMMGGAASLVLAVPALADVKAGVDAWERGDYAAAIAEWREPASEGDADAQFNLAQAYRLGRGVKADSREAESYYAQASAQGHLQAADNYGLLLFQDGRREEALPYVEAAAGRGDPRAQYLLGIAHFNGDMVEKDWVRAYALLTNANAAGLPQAAPAIAQMDGFIPLGQRQEAQDLAAKLKRDADTRRASQMAAADLSRRSGPVQVARAPAPAPIPATGPVSIPSATPARVAPPIANAAIADAPIARGASSIPRPIPASSVPPSVVAARNAVAEAARVTGTSSPAEAGADFARPATVASAAPALAAGSVPARAAVSPPPPKPAAERAAQSAPGRASADGPWRVQLGAFSIRGNADRLWQRLSGRPEFGGKQSFFVPAGRLTKLQAGGFVSRNAAQSACTAIKRGGTDCIVTR